MVRKQTTLTPAVRPYDDAATSRADETPRSAKVQKVAEQGEYAPGTIKRLEVHNFMVYEHNVLRPGPKLNLIMGPNGTGKSTWVAAICLVFNQNPGMLGRSLQTASYVKRDKREAQITIELQKRSGGSVKITRTIVKHSDEIHQTSRFFINREEVQADEVRQRASEYNVQLDNLCQFLPQERVHEFASMNGYKALQETEKALRDSELHQSHMKLIEEKNELNDLKSAEAKDREKYDQEKEMVEQRKKEFQQVERQERLRLEQRTIEAKKVWKEYWNQEEIYNERSERLRTKKQEKNEADRELNRLREPQKNVENEQKKALHDRKKQDDELNSYESDISKLEQNIRGHENEIAYHDDKMKRAKEEGRKRRQQIEMHQSQIEEAQEKLDNMPSDPTDTDKLSRLARERTRLESQIRDKDSELEYKNSESNTIYAQIKQKENRINTLQDEAEQAVSALKNERPNMNLTAFLSWLEENKERLNSHLYGPIVKEVKLADRKFASMFEKQVRPEDLLSFVTADSEDAKMLREAATKFKVIVNEVDLRYGTPQRKFSVDDLREYGIYTTLDQAFNAPREVKDVLIKTKMFNKCYIGDKKTESKIEELLHNRELIVYTHEALYSKTISQYDQNFSYTSHDPLMQPKFLGARGARKQDVDEEMREKGELEKQREERKKEYERLRQESDALRNKRDEIVNEIQALNKESVTHRQKIDTLKSQISKAKSSLQRLRNEKIEDEEIQEVENKKSEQQKKLGKNILRAAQEQSNLLQLLPRMSHLKLLEAQLGAQSKQLKEDLKDYENRTSHLDEVLKSAEESASQARKKMKELHRRAADTATLTDELREAFEHYSDDVEELAELAQMKGGEAEGIQVSNPNAMHEYQHRKEKMDELERKLQTRKSSIEEKERNVSELKDAWLPQLRGLVSKLDKCFSENFRKIGGRGGIELVEDGHDNFDKFRIDIKVAFRDSEDMHKLDGHRQSGGERSVSTMLYIIALQNLTKSPFRVVDEINQGMDIDNEKHMYQCMVEAATRNETPQCFVITPRLLPRMKYTKDVCISVIFRGTEMEEAARKLRNAMQHNKVHEYVWALTHRSDT